MSTEKDIFTILFFTNNKFLPFFIFRIFPCSGAWQPPSTCSLGDTPRMYYRLSAVITASAENTAQWSLVDGSPLWIWNSIQFNFIVPTRAVSLIYMRLNLVPWHCLSTSLLMVWAVHD